MSIELEGLEASNNPNVVELPANPNKGDKFSHVDDTGTMWNYTSNGNGWQGAGTAGATPLNEVVVMRAAKNSTSVSSNFNRYQEKVFNHEGGNVNDPVDKGGRTNKGIIFGNFKKWAKSDLGVEPTVGNLQGLTNEQAAIMYKKHYWDVFRGDEFQSGSVSFAIYDWTVTSGGAIKFLERKTSVLYNGITVDGKLSSSDVAALNKVDAKELFDKVQELRLNYFNMVLKNNVDAYKKSHPNATEKEIFRNTDLKFEKGWKNRINGIKFEDN